MKKKFIEYLETPFGKFLLETLRWAILGAVSAFVTAIADGIGQFGFNPSAVIIITAILRYIDSALHKSGVAEKGITRF